MKQNSNEKINTKHQKLKKPVDFMLVYSQPMLEILFIINLRLLSKVMKLQNEK